MRAAVMSHHGRVRACANDALIAVLEDGNRSPDIMVRSSRTPHRRPGPRPAPTQGRLPVRRHRALRTGRRPVLPAARSGMSACRVVTIGVPIAWASSRIVGAPPSESPSSAVALGWMSACAARKCAMTSRCDRMPANSTASARPSRATALRAAGSSGPLPMTTKRAPPTRGRARANASIASSSPFFSTKRPTKSTIDRASGDQRGYLSRSIAIGCSSVRETGAPAAMILRRISGPSARNSSPFSKRRA